MVTLALGHAVREVRDWGTAIVLHYDEVPGSMRPGYFTRNGKWIKPHWQNTFGVVQHQPWQKTCRAFARVHGYCAAVYCDDTAVEFTRLECGRVKQSARKPAKVDWFADRKAA